MIRGEGVRRNIAHADDDEADAFIKAVEDLNTAPRVRPVADRQPLAELGRQADG